MTAPAREDIIRMAREAGFVIIDSTHEECTERFFQAAYAAGAVAEREAILQMSRDQWFKTQVDFEDAIRARGETK